ncbi:hypothetical protein CEXT_95651 [Caerostris extrusa]|uniref:Secreted protein n=1 Tax=Caerostris extrusa TaxID=172846 RepID=A0AAV4RF00_CAEEX|nr:hypothetical protein CEXT_95651 [Caerostris extrusa]
MPVSLSLYLLFFSFSATSLKVGRGVRFLSTFIIKLLVYTSAKGWGREGQMIMSLILERSPTPASLGPTQSEANCREMSLASALGVENIRLL